jgi:D-tagatose-1,6-bisphosphate aldolase subunit GatZ/KbaZ
LVFEAHSTDYQQVVALSRLVVDHFAILKVGPQLTFALREALLLLATIEDELSHLLSDQQPSNLKAALVSVMEVEPGYWRNHYSKDPGKRRLEQFYSMSDRIRYYWPVPEVQSAVQSLLENLNSQTIPMTLISQYFPIEYDKIRRGELQNRPLDLIQSRVRNVLSAYASACGVLQPSTAGESK